MTLKLIILCACCMILGHLIGEFIRAAIRRYRTNREAGMMGIHYHWK